jgi:hypothetical protein
MDASRSRSTGGKPMSAREVIREALILNATRAVTTKTSAVLSAITSAGFRVLGPDDAKLVETALQHASFALDGVVSLDDEDEGKDGGSDTCQHAKRTVDRAIRALKGGGA